MTEVEGPLSGVRVVEFAGLSPVSLAGLLLASMGAEVIRIDRLTHDADSSANSLRRGRRSVVLDLKRPEGLSAARRLLSSADVVLEGYRPGVMERLQLGPTDAHEINPRIVFGRLTGWGQTGPFAQAAGHDITYLALTGALHAMGPGEGSPVPPLNLVADMGAGTMLLLVGILAALHERTVSGHGQVVDSAMVDGVPTLAATVLRALSMGDWSRERGRNYLDGGAPFYRTYECADGGFIAVGAIEPHFYKQFIEGLGLHLNDLPDQWDRDNWPDLSRLIAETVWRESRETWERRFDGTDACVSAVLDFDEAAQHPHMVAREAFDLVDGHLQPGVAPKLDRTPLRSLLNKAPQRGLNTRQVLSEAGYSSEEIDALISSGVALSASDDATRSP